MRFLSGIFITLCIFLTSQSFAVDFGLSDSSDTTKVATKLPVDDFNRRNPRGTVLGYLDAMAHEDYEKAGRYLSLDYLSKSEQDKQRAKIAVNLKKSLDLGGTIDATALISNNPNGDQGDDLSMNLDQIGTVIIGPDTIPVLVEKVSDDEGNPIWLFASQTIKRIPDEAKLEFYSRLDRYLPSFFVENKFSGGALGHWMAVVVILILALVLSWLITYLIFSLIIKFLRHRVAERHKKVINAFLVPIRLWLIVTIFIFIAREIGISILVRQFILPATIFIYYLGFLILLWQITNVLSVIIENKMTKKRNFAALTGIEFTRRSIKIILIAAGVIIALKLNGQDVTNWLAAIGIGGIALALGAQKTIENIVGSISLIADQPIRIGDFCRVDQYLGTIIQIGIRSTRIRTLNRTIVTIPNGEFSTHKIENYTRRDTFLLRENLSMRYETTPDQLRYLLVEVRALLHAHPKVNNDPNHPEPTRVRFIEFGSDSLVIEVYAQIITDEYHLFLEIKEDINLRIMDIIEKSGTSFAFPSSTLYLSRDKGVSQEKTKKAEEFIHGLKDKKQLPLPEYSYEQAQSLKGTIRFPSDDSVLS